MLVVYTGRESIKIGPPLTITKSALIEGINNVKTKYLCIFNADGSFDPKYLNKIFLSDEIPFPNNYFDLTTVAFGLRNMTHKEVALKEMLRVIKPGGKAMVLEFSKPVDALKPIYDALPRRSNLHGNARGRW